MSITEAIAYSIAHSSKPVRIDTSLTAIRAIAAELDYDYDYDVVEYNEVEVWSVWGWDGYDTGGPADWSLILPIEPTPRSFA